MTGPPFALSAYESLAPAYDDLTADHDHDTWLSRLEELAIDHGLAGRDVLDVACRTGRSFAPLLRRGYRVTACDASPAMAALAAGNAPGADVYVADMRAPGLGEGRFDLVTCLDGALNELPDRDALRDAFRAAAALLRPGGVYLLDLVSLRDLEAGFGHAWCRQTAQRMFVWEGCALEGEGPGCSAHGTLHVFEKATRETWTHRQVALARRHFPKAEVHAALADAGLVASGPYGMQPDGSLFGRALEWRDSKIVYVARRPGGPQA